MSNDKEGFAEETEIGFTYPCEFPVKVMGKTCAEFEVAVLEIMHRHVPDLAEGTIKMRPSSKGNYTAITITFQAQSREQLDAIYIDLTACALVAYVL